MSAAVGSRWSDQYWSSAWGSHPTLCLYSQTQSKDQLLYSGSGAVSQRRATQQEVARHLAYILRHTNTQTLTPTLMSGSDCYQTMQWSENQSSWKHAAAPAGVFLWYRKGWIISFVVGSVTSSFTLSGMFTQNDHSISSGIYADSLGFICPDFEMYVSETSASLVFVCLCCRNLKNYI